jgi:hypothetical protein
MAFASITTEQLKFLLDTCREVRATQWFRNQQQKPKADDIGLAYVKFRNDADETVPPHAAMMITGTDEIDGDTYVTVAKPTGPTDAIIINNDYPVAAGQLGSGFKWGWVRVLANGFADPNTQFTTEAGEWALTPGPGPVVLYGRDYVADGVYAGRLSDNGSHWEIEAQIQSSSLKATDAGGTATYLSIRQKPVGACDPPEIDGNGNVQYNNPWRLDAHCNAKVILEYIDDRCGNQSARWEIKQVERYRARWIKFRYEVGSSESISVDEFWEGEDPEACGDTVTVEYPLGQPCVDSDVVACYDPFTFTYKAISSESAMLGPASTIDVVQSMAFDDCGIDYTKQSVRVFPCGTQPSVVSIAPTLVSVDVLTGADFEMGTETCDTAATWSWNEGTSAWDVVTACESGCTATSPPTLPPGEWNSFAVSHESPCTRSVITGLEFTKSVVQVCASMTTTADVIPITNCPPEATP